MSQPGYVYIIRGVGTAYIKVGKTTSLERRLRDLGHGVPFKIALLYAHLVHDMDREEQRLKALYAPFRTRGEWFEFPAEALAAWPDVQVGIPEVVQPVVVRTARPIRDRVLAKLFQHGSLTERQIGQQIGVRSAVLRPLIQALISEGALDALPQGKTVVYLHPSDRMPEMTERADEGEVN
jgi:Meiotically up-regulated gene 113